MAQVYGQEVVSLSNQELTALHNKSMKGNPKAKQELWMHGVRLVWKIVDKLIGVKILDESLREDAIQQGLLAIGESLPKWDPKRGRYSTFVWTAIRNALLDMAVSEDRRGLTGDVNIKDCIQEILEHEEEPEVAEEAPEVEDVDLVQQAMWSLPPHLRAVVFDHYYKDMSDAQIAEKLSISRTTAFALRKEAVRQMSLEVGNDLIQFGFD